MSDAASFIAAGLYDPDADDAQDRLALLEYLAAVGCTFDEMRRADAEGRLFGLSGDRLIRPGRDTYTWEQVAEKVGVTLELLERALRSYGVPYVGPDQPFASDADVELLRGFAFFEAVSGEANALGLARVLGNAMAKVAEAASSSVRGTTPNLQLEYAASPLALAKTYEQIAQQVPLLGGQLDTLFRHHLVSARRLFEASDSADLASQNQIRVGVGFADLSGFTALAERLSPQQLSAVLTSFETQVSDVVDQLGGRVVKFIGDEVMYIAPKASQAAEIALHIARGAPKELPARVGIAYGIALATDGDYFGPPVNLASRLVDHAAPGEVLAGMAMVERLDTSAGWVVREERTLDLRGIGTGVTVALLDHLDT